MPPMLHAPMPLAACQALWLPVRSQPSVASAEAAVHFSKIHKELPDCRASCLPPSAPGRRLATGANPMQISGCRMAARRA